jgi:hypothetical protein
MSDEGVVPLLMTVLASDMKIFRCHVAFFLMS